MRIRIALFGNEHVRYYEKDISYYQRFVTFRGRPATPIKRRFFVPFKKTKQNAPGIPVNAGIFQLWG